MKKILFLALIAIVALALKFLGGGDSPGINQKRGYPHKRIKQSRVSPPPKPVPPSRSNPNPPPKPNPPPPP